jgi:DNA-binding NarL/FixJ family response regulator
MGTPVISTESATPSVAPCVGARVVVIDGRQDRRELMRLVVEHSAADLSVVGYADGPVSAVDAVGRLGATAALVEIQLPVSQALDTISSLRHDYPELRIIVCSFHQDRATRQAALDRGADAFLRKPISHKDLQPLLRASPSNGSWPES